MKVSFALCSVLLILFVGFTVTQTCDLATIKTDRQMVIDVVNSLQNKQLTGNATDAEIKFKTLVNSIQMDANACWTALANKYIATTNQVNVPVYRFVLLCSSLFYVFLCGLNYLLLRSFFDLDKKKPTTAMLASQPLAPQNSIKTHAATPSCNKHNAVAEEMS